MASVVGMATFQYKSYLLRYGDPHCKDKSIVRPSCFVIVSIPQLKQWWFIVHCLPWRKTLQGNLHQNTDMFLLTRKFIWHAVRNQYYFCLSRCVIKDQNFGVGWHAILVFFFHVQELCQFISTPIPSVHSVLQLFTNGFSTSKECTT